MEKFREVPVTYACNFSGNHTHQTYSRDYYTEVQRLVSISHAPLHRQLGRSQSDIGGPFFSTKMKWSGLPAKVRLQGDLSPSDNGWKSEGILVPPGVETQMRLGWSGSVASLNSRGPAPQSDNAMWIKGSSAISRCLPTSPVLDAASSIAEMYGAGVITTPYAAKSGKLPSNKKELGEINTAKEFLNYQFGYAPLARDILTLRDTMQRSDEILAQLERDSGKPIRRSYKFPVEDVSSNSGSDGTAFPIFMGGAGPTVYEVGLGEARWSTSVTREYRFAGAFTFYLPPKGTWRRKLYEADRLYGLVPGLDTGWNALPFSWLADYYGNFGDVMENLTAFAQDGLVMKYGYITCRTQDLVRYTWSYPVRLDGARNAWSNQSGSVERVFSHTQRMPANPYGFGPTGVPLSGRQKAIVAALGLSRV